MFSMQNAACSPLGVACLQIQLKSYCINQYVQLCQLHKKVTVRCIHFVYGAEEAKIFVVLQYYLQVLVLLFQKYIVLPCYSWTKHVSNIITFANLRRIQEMIAKKQLAIPHQSTLSRTRIRLDLLLMRMRAQRFASMEQFFLFVSTDSSPQGHSEYLMSIEDCIQSTDCRGCLSTNQEELASWNLANALRSSTLPVAVLGSGNTNLPAKWTALIQSINADCCGQAAIVRKYVGSIVGYCSDFGTEWFIDQARWCGLVC